MIFMFKKRVLFISCLLFSNLILPSLSFGSHKNTSQQWITIGKAGFSRASVSYISLRVDKGTPYVSYGQSLDTLNLKYTLSIMKYDGSDWVKLGYPFLDFIYYNNWPINSPAFCVDNGIPYVGYCDDEKKFIKLNPIPKKMIGLLWEF